MLWRTRLCNLYYFLCFRRGRGRGRRSYSEKGNQVYPNAFEVEPKSEPKIEDRKVNDQDVKPIEKKMEEIKISETETKVS